jgi:hypothetical protein
MPQWKTVSQRNFLKGLQATYGLLSQPGAILTRLSNMLYDRRGAVRTTDGSAQIATSSIGTGVIADFVLYQPPGVGAYYVGVQRQTAEQVTSPSGLTLTALQVGGAISSIIRAGGIVTLITATPHNLAALNALNALPFSPGNMVVAGTGTDLDTNVLFDRITVVSATEISYANSGADRTAATGTLGTSLAPGTYAYSVTSCDGIGGETPGSPTATIVLAAPNNVVQLTWTAGPFAALFAVYGVAHVGVSKVGRVTPGIGGAQTVPGTTFFDIGLISTFNATPPGTNTTQTTIVYRLDPPNAIETLANLPPFPIPSLGGIPGAYGPEQPGANIGGGPTAQGGVPGLLSPLPQMAQFTGRLVLALGNGYPPQQYTDGSIDGTGFETISNAFTAQYPDWQASVAWNTGDQILDSVSGGVFQAQQSGSSGTARPTFVNTLNATTADNTVIWLCTITKITPTALRGAAHAIVYAGSLWLANTWPTSTSDLLDGPNVLKMSDVNTLTSWNPLNIAFIAKDDGDQITGLGTFTIAESGISPTGSQVIFKNFTTYQVTGVFGASDFAIQQAQTDLGCVAPRTIQFVPGFGLMRLTHLGFAYFNGVADKLESEPIRPYLFGGVGDVAPIDWNYAWFSKAAQCANPPMYVCAVPVQAPTLSGVTMQSPGPGFEVEMFARVTQLTLDADGNYQETAITPEAVVVAPTATIQVTTPAAQPNVLYRAYIGFVAGGENAYTQAASFTAANLPYGAMTPGVPTIGNGALKRLICYDLVQRAWAVIDLPFPISAVKQIRAPGTIPLTLAGGFSDSVFRRMFAGDVAWDTGAAVIWSFDGSEVFEEGGSGKVFYRRLSIRGEKTGAASIQVAITLAGLAGTPITAQQNNLGTNQWLFRVDILKDALNAHATVSGTGPVTIDSLDWQVKAKPAGAPISIQK